MFPAGTAVITTMNVIINTISEEILESNEDFTVEIFGTTPIAAMGVPSTQALIINNDDSECCLYQLHSSS